MTKLQDARDHICKLEDRIAELSTELDVWRSGKHWDALRRIEELTAENEKFGKALGMLEYDCYGVAYVYPDRRLVNTLLTGVDENLVESELRDTPCSP